MKNYWKPSFAPLCAVLVFGSALPAQQKCPVEVKLLLAPSTIETVVASLNFEKETAGRVYFYDTDELDLLKQGVIVRVRQGADNDLTVKVRVPEGNKQVDTTQLRKDFPCEIDWTGVGDGIGFSIRRKFKVSQVPEMGSDVLSLLSPPQEKLLREARASIDWARVKRLANIKGKKWETTSQSSFRRLSLELWEWPTGNILELSTKVGPDAGQATYDELQRLVDVKGLALSASQGTKTSIVLETYTHTSPPQ